MRTITLQVLSRYGCPHRKPANGDWGPQVPHCEHPERRGDLPWCPDGPGQRDDDPWKVIGHRWVPVHLFPAGCPLTNGEVVSCG